MNRFFLILWALLVTMSVQAQFVNYGATITIQPGATLRIETSFENQAGTIDNQGTLEVLGNFTNAAGAGTTLSGNGTVKFIGDANSNVTTNGDALQNVEMAKTAQNITLQDAMTINGTLTFTSDNNKIILGSNDLTIGASGSIVSSDDNEYVVTNGTGRLVKAVGAAASIVTMQIGDASNYTPLQITMTGNAAGNVSARTLISPLTSKYNDADAYINREWVVSTPTITSTSLQGTYVNGDAIGTASNIKGCTYQGSGEWNFAGFAGAANSVTATTTNNTDVILSGQNFFGKANLKVFLQGPYNTTSGLMNTTLNSSGILQANATISPYLDASANVGAGFFAANPTIVDWIKLEFRDPSTPNVSTSNKISAFLKSDGTIVAKDGGSLLPRLKNCPYTNNAVIVISHRNHLPIRTVNSGLNVVDVSSRYDFNTGYDKAFVKDGVANPNMNILSTGVYGMWAGDINQDGEIKYNLSNNDRALIYTAIGGASQNSTITGYRNEDLNLDGIVKYNLSNNDRALMYISIGGASQNAKTLVHN